MLELTLRDTNGRALAQARGEGELQLFYAGYYGAGDYIELICPGRAPAHVALRPDRAVDEASVYLPEGRMRYAIPTGELRRAYPPQAFSGDRHVASARVLSEWEIRRYRNLALNPADLRQGTGAFPHVEANVETRGESVFAARNIIDGMKLSAGHGDWPYQSWGIGTRTDAWVELSFGRKVKIDKMALFLRADFPHDAYWTQASVRLSDGFEKTFPLARIEGAQWVALGEHVVTGMKLQRLIKSDDPSAFPALTEWEVYGYEMKDEENDQ